MKKDSFLIIVLFITFSISAQLEIGLTLSPSASTLYSKSGPDFSKNYFQTINIGLNVRKHFRSLSIASGISHLTHGLKYESRTRTTDIPDGGLESYEYIDRYKMITIPILFEYNFLKKEKVSLFSSVGMLTGYIYSQEQEVINKSNQETNQLINLNTFNDIYFGWNVGVTYRHKLTERLTLHLRPNYIHQIRKTLPKETHAWTTRMKSWNFDIGIYYLFLSKK